MPIYEYSCSACEERFELLVPISEADARPPCPSCNSPDTRKLLSLFARSGSGKSDSASEAPKPSGGGGGHCGPGGCGCGRF